MAAVLKPATESIWALNRNMVALVVEVTSVRRVEIDDSRAMWHAITELLNVDLMAVMFWMAASHSTVPFGLVSLPIAWLTLAETAVSLLMRATIARRWRVVIFGRRVLTTCTVESSTVVIGLKLF
uniref:(northern house mosquito) hypothetical protein n=1 Tax=Culex pipiens TaxID=7175 RepID=A0A8D8BWU6_CULPI